MIIKVAVENTNIKKFYKNIYGKKDYEIWLKYCRCGVSNTLQNNFEMKKQRCNKRYDTWKWGNNIRERAKIKINGVENTMLEGKRG